MNIDKYPEKKRKGEITLFQRQRSGLDGLLMDKSIKITGWMNIWGEHDVNCLLSEWPLTHRTTNDDIDLVLRRLVVHSSDTPTFFPVFMTSISIKSGFFSLFFHRFYHVCKIWYLHTFAPTHASIRCFLSPRSGFLYLISRSQAGSCNIQLTQIKLI